MKNTMRDFLKIPATVIAGCLWAVGYVLGILWVPFAEGLDDGAAFVDDDVVGYLWPELDVTDEDDTP